MVSEALVNIGSGNGLLRIQYQAITWTNGDIFSIGPLRKNFSKIWKYSIFY